MKSRKWKIRKFIPSLFLIVLVVLVFRSWFSFKPVAARDWIFAYPQNLKELSPIPYLWDNQAWAGMGRVNFYNWSIFYFFGLVKVLSFLGLSWSVIEKIIWFWPYLLLSIFSSSFLFKVLFPKNRFWFFAPFVFLFNPFSLIITSGGQMGLALAFTLTSLVFTLLIKSLGSSLIARYSLLFSLVLAFQLMLDPRVFYITVLISGSYIVYKWFWKRLNFLIAAFSFVLATIFALGLNLFWILPVFLTRGPVLPETYGESGWVRFLSFARFSDALSLLHPFWPENIFGKTYFFRQEFLFLPLVAFSGLLLLKSRKSEGQDSLKKSFPGNGVILFFGLLALTGTFLAKGSGPPFGGIYLWLFKNMPGFNMFRDPVKFYTLIVFSYSVLIPHSIFGVHAWLTKRFEKQKPKLGTRTWAFLPNLFLLLTVCYLLFLTKPAFSREIGGTFKTIDLPKEYLSLANFLNQDKDFGRSFWLPRRPNFGFYSHAHPPVWAEQFVSEAKENRPFSSLMTDKYDFLSYFQNPATREIFKILGLRYVIVPFDSQEEIFLKDRKYDPQQFQRRIEALDQASWLKKSELTSKIGLYQADFETDHFFPVKSTFFVLGADDFYATVSGLPEVDLSEYGFYFLEERLGEKPKPKLGDFLVFNQKTEEDLALSFLEQENVYPFYPFLKKEKHPGWEAIDLINSARTVGLGNTGFDFGQNMVLSRGEGIFSFPFKVSQRGEYQIWIRVLMNRLGGELQLSLDEGQRLTIETQTPKDGFVWKRIGEGFVLDKGEHQLEMKNRRGLNGLNLLAVFQKEKFDEYQKKAEKYLNENRVLTFSESNQFKIPPEVLKKKLPQIGSKMVSSTRYLVKVKEAPEPFWLVFSETFHPLWRAKIGEEEIAPIRLFSLINGFYIERTGDFEIEVGFEPQKYVYWGMLGSGLTLLFILYSLAKPTSFSRVISSALSMFRTALAKFSLVSKS